MTGLRGSQGLSVACPRTYSQGKGQTPFTPRAGPPAAPTPNPPTPGREGGPKLGEPPPEHRPLPPFSRQDGESCARPARWREPGSEAVMSGKRLAKKAGQGSSAPVPLLWRVPSLPRSGSISRLPTAPEGLLPSPTPCACSSLPGRVSV